MKKIISSIFLSGLLFVSCNTDDFLTKSPGSSFNYDDVILTEADLQAAVNGMYDAMQQEGMYGKNVFGFGVAMSDIGFISVSNTNRLTSINNFTVTASSGDVFDMWDDLYEVIQRANFIINKTELSSSSSVDVLLSQAYTGRALAYFNLVNYFGQPFGETPNAGVPIDLDDLDGSGEPRSTVEEVYDQVEADLLQALKLSPQNGDKNTLGEDAINLILSRLYLYKKDYKNALSYAEAVKSSGSYTVLSGDDYVNYWVATEGGGESIFELTYTSSDQLGINSSLPYLMAIDGYNDLFARADFVNAMDDEDVRKRLYKEGSKPDDPVGYNVLKHLQYDSSSDSYVAAGDYDMKVLRYVEADFNAMEAKYHMADEEGALEDLNTFIANRASGVTYSSSGDQLLEDILTERAREFAFEGQRFLDLRRNGEDIMKETNCTVNCEMTYPNDKFVLPIPQSEIDTNNAISEEDQNPSY